MTDGAADAGKLKIFISWSGRLSQEVAKVWHELLGELFDNVTPFMSEKDIEAGTRGLPTIASELRGSKFGIVVVTQQNLHSQWLNYETGALSKDINDPDLRVAPTLVDFQSEADATGPISQFQATLLNHDGIAEILAQVARSVGADVTVVAKRFERAWDGDFKQRFDDAKVSHAQPVSRSRRDETDKIDEILTLIRDSKADSQSLENARKFERANVVQEIQERYIAFRNIHLVRAHHENKGNYVEIYYVLKDGQSFTKEELAKFATDLSLIHNGPTTFLTENEYKTSPLISQNR
ncbi:hypothetical protein BS618_32955 [Rhodococcus erythropolis]|uniref:TIR domain-containing protein n=1 Tax=Rhodococcus qingshengii TaxID=334542 RepID=UPI000936331A|nr:TIR domain-containing protein [Rhodococcus qingshengii]MCZ4548199.1 TIR domain-containing protein [Rhodococcus qingshengii]OKA07060.1 hypothetical protein BS618_32955 [Rhodococcus erythropolis]